MQSVVDHQCRAQGCPNLRGYSTGLCPKHHYRFTRHGTTELPPRRTLRERFEAQFTPEPFSGCWLWNGATDHNERGFDYGVININRSAKRAHRVAYELYIEPIPDSNHFVCHRCDTPSCVNPAHLFLGSNQVNISDCVAKGRNARGERSGAAVLTDKQVMAIRALYASGEYTYKTLGAQFGVDYTAIYKIVKQKRWRHLCL